MTPSSVQRRGARTPIGVSGNSLFIPTVLLLAGHSLLDLFISWVWKSIPVGEPVRVASKELGDIVFHVLGQVQGVGQLQPEWLLCQRIYTSLVSV